jgi:hypothetical protein
VAALFNHRRASARSISPFEIRRAWQAANKKARELGWIAY